MLADERTRLIDEAIEQLPDNYREVLILRDIEGADPVWAGWVERWYATSTLTPTVRAMLALSLGSSVLVYLFLVINFQSWIDPLIVLMAVPVSATVRGSLPPVVASSRKPKRSLRPRLFTS